MNLEKTFFSLSMLMGVILVAFSLQLKNEIFYSAKIFGLSIGMIILGVCLYKVFCVSALKKCPVCGLENKRLSDTCRGCGYNFSVARKKENF